MSSAFCSLDEAFSAPPPPGGKSKKKGLKREEQFVPTVLESTPDTRQPPPELLHGAPPTTAPNTKLEGSGLQDFFPLPGETAEPDEWQKAFTLEPSRVPQALNYPIPVDNKPTLWRQIPQPVAANITTDGAPIKQVAPVTGVPAEFIQRLDALTKQIDALTMPSPFQSTAELFLFVAIGLLILLAIDTLLRFATAVVSKKQGGGGLVFTGRRSRYMI
jgi:hypothetical protein